MTTSMTKRLVVAATLLVILFVPEAAFGHGVEGETALSTTKIGSVCRERDVCANTFTAAKSGAVEGELSILTSRWAPLIEGSFASVQYFEARYTKTVIVRGARNVTAEATWKLIGKAVANGDSEASCVVRTNKSGKIVLAADGLAWPPEPDASIDTVDEEVTLTATFNNLTGSTKQITVWTELVCGAEAWPLVSKTTLEVLSGSGLAHFHVTRT